MADDAEFRRAISRARHGRSLAAAGQAIDRCPGFHQYERRPEQEYFADGIAETSSRRCRAVARFSSSPATPASPTRARRSMLSMSGRELGVRYVLEGSVRRSGERSSASPRSLLTLRQATTSGLNATIADLEDVFAVQDEISVSSREGVLPAVSDAGAASAALRRPPGEPWRLGCISARSMAHGAAG